MIEYIDIIRTLLIAFLITLLLGPLVIPMLRKLKIGQSIREEGPKSHLSKSGTPTMGGLIILLSLIITIFSSGIVTKDTYVLVLLTLGFGLIGLIDDYLIVVKKSNLGLKPSQKLIGQIVLAVILAVYQSNTSELGTKVIIPFVENHHLDLGILYIPFIAFVVVGTVNSVNLTDGLDGLASGVTLIVMSFWACFFEVGILRHIHICNCPCGSLLRVPNAQLLSSQGLYGGYRVFGLRWGCGYNSSTIKPTPNSSYRWRNLFC